MSTTMIGSSFPETWAYGEYEVAIHRSLKNQIEQRWPNCENLLLDTTWWGPHNDQQVADMVAAKQKFRNLFITSTVDDVLNFKVYPLIDQLQSQFEIENVYRLGNFDSEHQFNFFAIVCLDKFKAYNTDDLILRELRWKYCAYNRKPYPHRLNFVRDLIDNDLEQHGVITLGKAFPGETDHGLYRSIGESNADYVQWGHWYEVDSFATTHDIPHDLFSLHNWTVWQHHFLHIVGATTAHNEIDTFVNQINFKPLIGMRPFVINGQTKQYQYLRQHGFRTFNHYWPQFDLEKQDELRKQQKILLDCVKWLTTQSTEQIMTMYQDMLPDLVYNRQRWYEWAAEQKHYVNNIFNE